MKNVSSSSQKQAADKITDDFLLLLGSEGREFWEAVKKIGRQVSYEIETE